MTNISASILQSAWRKVDVKVSLNGDLHILRWRRGLFVDEVLFDDRRVATSSGLFVRESIYRLNIETPDAGPVKLVFMVDPEPDWNDWSGKMAPRGIRVETADEALVAAGSLGPDRMEPFRQLYDRAVKAFGLS